jgi:hypothetical protein
VQADFLRYFNYFSPIIGSAGQDFFHDSHIYNASMLGLDTNVLL